MLNLHQINVFLIAAETLNFTQAAQRLEMTQPSVSQHIQALEQYFETDLFIRAGRSLELTDAGYTLIQMAREMVYFSNHIEERMRSLKGKVHGHLMVGCSTTTGRYILPRLLADFHLKCPQVRATCHVASQERALQMLCSGHVHLAICSQPEICKDVEFRQFATDQIQLIAPLDHPWAQKDHIGVQELLAGEFILPDIGTDTHAAVHAALNHQGLSLDQLDALMVLGSTEAIGLSVKEGLGVGFVSNIVVQKLVKDEVKIIPVQGLDINQEIYIGRFLNRPHTSAQDAFWDFIFEAEENAIIQSLYNEQHLAQGNLVMESSSEG
jgi:DNA-binding transcriptional LysR family regulator